MVLPKYIRHIHGSERVSSVDTSVFADDLPDFPYRDLVKLHHIVDDHSKYTYTLGKCLFPSNFEAVSAFQRWILIIVAEGHLNGMGHWLEKGDFLFVPASIPHSLKSPAGERPLYYWCTSDDEMLDGVLGVCGIEDHALVGHCDHLDAVAELFERTIYRQISAVDSRIYFVGVFSQVLSYFSQTAGSIGEKLPIRLFERCVSYIEYCQGRLTVEELANFYYVSRQYLYHIFMKYGGASPQKFIMDAKMKAADKFLCTTDYSIAQIAERLLYNNYNHFSQAFKKYYGILPGERRKQIGKLQ